MIQLREYQKRLIDCVRNEIKRGKRRVMMVLPTGGGKSHIIGSIAKRCLDNGHKVLALMHRRQLVTQLVERFEDCGVNSGVIMSGEECSLDCRAQVATCQTYGRRMQLDDIAFNRWWIDASVVFVDEAHHAMSKTYQRILKSYENKIVIGVTATPILASGIGMGEYFDAIVQPVGVKELIDAKHLVPGVYYGPSAPDLSKLRTVAGDYHKGDLEKVMNQPKLVGDVVENWLKIAGDRKTMVFAVKVNHSKAIRQEFEWKGVKAEHLDANAPDDVREATLDRFRNGETQVICNVGLYTEGTDIPEIECIVLARPTKSMGLYLQMIGRGARPHDGKKDFIIIDHGGCIERLGFYEDEIEWSLDGKKVGYRKKKQRKAESRYMTCDECRFVFRGSKCPQCGTVVKDYGKKIAALDAELVEIGKDKRKYTMKDKRNWYSMLRHYCRDKGYSDGWADHKYREKFGVWPRNVTGPLLIPNREVINFIRYTQIKWAKGQKKMAEVAV